MAYATLLVVVGIITLPFGVPVLPVDTFIQYSNLLPYARSVKTERDEPTSWATPIVVAYSPGRTTQFLATVALAPDNPAALSALSRLYLKENDFVGYSATRVREARALKGQPEAV